MGSQPLARAGDHRILAWTTALVGLVLVGSLALVPAASSATVTSAWQAKIGAKGVNGTAKLQVYDSGTGSLTLRLVKMRPATLLPVVLHKGTCSAVGPVLARLDAIRSSSAGVANRTSSLTVTRVRAILAATRSGKLAIRVGSGSALRCGLFAALTLPTPTPMASPSTSPTASASPSTSPTASASPTPSPSGGGTLFVTPYFMLVIPTGWFNVPVSNPSAYSFQGPGHQLAGVRTQPTTMSLPEYSASVLANLKSLGSWGDPEQTEAITIDGVPGQMMSFHLAQSSSLWLDVVCVHNGRGYEIVFTNTPGTEGADRAFFLSFLNSFRFLSAG